MRGQEHERAIRTLADMGEPAVGVLCEAMGDPRAPVRRAAAAALCDIGDARALAPLLRLLYAHDWLLDDLYRSGRILQVPGMRQEMLRILEQGLPSEQYPVLQALMTVRDDEEVVAALAQLLRDEHAHSGSRTQALWALCAMCPAQRHELIAEALRDAALARRRTGYILWCAQNHGVLPPLDACLRALKACRRPAGQRSAACYALEHGAEGRAALRQALESDAPDERIAVAMALAVERAPKALDVLCRAAAGGKMTKKQTRQVCPILGRHYGDELVDWVEREQPDLARTDGLVWALTYCPSERARELIERLLHTGTPSVRTAALRVLARARGADFLSELRRCLRDGKPGKMAQEACRQMLKLGEAAEPTAVAMLDSEHWTERKAGACLLRRWGRLTPQQQEKLAADPHIAVRRSAQWHPNYDKPHPLWGRPARKR